MVNPSTEGKILQVLDIISTSDMGIVKACKKVGTSLDSVHRWIKESDENYEKYARAREQQADLLVDQIIEIADDTTHDTIVNDKGEEFENREWVNRSKLRIEARKWKAAKLKPKVYGDKLDLTSKGEKMQPPVIINLGSGINPDETTD